MCVGGAPDGAPLAMAHAKFFSGRSAFLVFIRLPDGRQATLDYLDKLGKAGSPLVAREVKLADGTPHRDTDFRPDLPQLPAGTQVALVRQIQDKMKESASKPPGAAPAEAQAAPSDMPSAFKFS